MEKANKVMIIDDEKTFIIPLEIGLKRMGIEVISFTNPEEAVEYLKNNKVDVLLTDYHMEPNINGDEVIHRVREFNKEIIIYLQTGYAEKLPADEMLEKNKKGEIQVRTAHSLNPVPFIIVDDDNHYEFEEGNYGLANVAPTIVKMMGLQIPTCWEKPMIK